jgi:hypothetical protein
MMFRLCKNNVKAASGEPGYGPLFKIHPVSDSLIKKFQDVYTLEEQLTLGAAVCPFRECIFFHVHSKGNLHKYGIKMFKLCEAESGTSHQLRWLSVSSGCVTK